ncbi:MAG: HDOD domain-containing protein [Verrucomicrobia bacterium]|nr:HDOD domain-containing protein [Verrucomicrobiota bacterium]
MKKRILFVNSQPAERQLFQQLLADQQDAWNIAFVSSAQEALALLTREPADVLFADAQLADMPGLELLAEAAKIRPRTVRFVLADEANNELIMQCVWNTHQYLSKQSSPGEFVTTVSRSLAADSWLANEKLKTLVTRMRTLPALPSLYFEVLRELNSPTASAERVGEIIGKDLAMTAKIVQMVNSAYFGLPRTITTPTEAVLILGMETVKSLVLSIHAYAQFDKVRPLYFTAEKVWKHCLRVGAAAKRITELEFNNPKLAEEALTAGLFHDLGKLLMATNVADEYNGAQALAKKQNLPLWEVEKEIFGATHGETGAYLLGLWGLSTPIVEAVALHNAPSRTLEKMFAPLTAVHVANAFDYETNPEKDSLAPPALDLAYLTETGMAGRLADWQQAIADPTQRKPVAKSAKGAKTTTTANVAPSQADAQNVAARPWWIWGAALAGIAVLAVLFFLIHNRDASRSAVTTSNPTPQTQTSPAEPSVPATVAPPVVEKAEPAKTSAALPSADERKSAVSAIAKPVANLPAKAAATPNLRLQGIFYKQNRPSALINGQTVFVGDSVDGARVTAIDQESTTLQVGGEQKVLKLR